ncbi:MAG: IS5 family transposase, partial [Waterburya sp.]
EQPINSLENFELHFEGKLSKNNRWVIMTKLIPWSEFEEEYASLFSSQMGAPAKTFRIALGSLIIKEKLGISDAETVEQIRENPYLQYFIGLSDYSNEAPFESSMLSLFRQRIDRDLVNKINQSMVSRNQEETASSVEKKTQPKKELTNRGKLIIDATCCPADIAYPTDLNLLNQARIVTEKIIDKLYKPLRTKLKSKPKTYRQVARKSYLKIAKQRKPRNQARKSAIKQQLQYISRNLSHIEKLLKQGASLGSLTKKELKNLLVVTEVYRQQLWMYENKSNRIEDRIVSIKQPHIRPLVRGKAGSSVEFGAKISASYFDGYVFLDYFSWDNFNESLHLIEQVESFQERTGYYPESVHVDKIYRTRKNRAFCQEKGIRISGVPLGRPPKNISDQTKKQAQKDERIRNAIEGKFGQGKRRFSLNKIMTKLPSTSTTTIAIIFLVMNLSALLKEFLSRFLVENLWKRFLINLSYFQDVF